MAGRTVNLLHVEDDAMQRELTALQLASVPETAFQITHAESEAEAIAQFSRSRQEIVILDYHLAQGNGLSCLKKLRSLDAIVPIIALSGKATPEIAAELLRAGADNYLSKVDLPTQTFTACVMEAIIRADAWRRLAPPLGRVPASLCERQARELFRQFATGIGPELLLKMDGFEAAARAENLELSDLQRWFDDVSAELAGSQPSEQSQRILRPILLEMLVRLWGEVSPGSGRPPSSSDSLNPRRN